jgi:AcrR family transcriptional regulator
MSPAGGKTVPPQRRRGAALESAILDAAWQLLVETGYGGFNIDAVADRARTGRAVIYRRWPTREHLLHAAVRQRGDRWHIDVPDTGALRTDVLAALQAVNTQRADLSALLSAHLGEYYDETGGSPSTLHDLLVEGSPRLMTTIVERAVARGEVDPRALTPRVTSLPMDLLRHEVFMRLRPATEETLADIVDEIFMPLVSRRRESIDT